jgi:hypothetical protein
MMLVDFGGANGLLSWVWSGPGAVIIEAATVLTPLTLLTIWWSSLALGVMNISIPPLWVARTGAALISVLWAIGVLHSLLDPLVSVSVAYASVIQVLVIIILTLFFIYVGIRFVRRLRKAKKFGQNSQAFSKRSSYEKQLDVLLRRTGVSLALMSVCILIFIPLGVWIIFEPQLAVFNQFMYVAITCVKKLAVLYVVFIVPNRSISARPSGESSAEKHSSYEISGNL